jgi:DNA-binding MarR family transcriptional regulator
MAALASSGLVIRTCVISSPVIGDETGIPACTASQAIKALEAGGYLVRQRSQADGRSVTLRLTDKGNEVIARDPFEGLVRAVGSLDAEEQTAMHDALHHVLSTVAASGAHRHFGVCQDCAYLGRETCRSSTSATGSALECLLFGVQKPGLRLTCMK